MKDITPPVVPTKLKMVAEGDSVINLSWEAEADIESGIGHFNIYRDGQVLVRYPSEGDYQKFDTNGDDAVPTIPIPMVLRVLRNKLNTTDVITIATVNRFDLKSPKAKFVFPDVPK